MGYESVRSSTQVDAFVGARLRLIRRETKMSQTELGERVQVSFQQIQKYEKGCNRIGASRLWEFCQIFRVEPSFFFLGLEGTLKGPGQAVISARGTRELKKQRLAS